MRFKSGTIGGYTAYAVSGVNTISFALDASGANTKGLLGFAVERHDKTENQRYYLRGQKVFRDLIPEPDESTDVSTFEHPVQSLVWDDFTAKPDHEYEYFFHPLKGRPKFLDRSAEPIAIAVRTEPLNGEDQEHAVFFNRGAASSQAYAKRFGNQSPSQIQDGTKREEAYAWLSRDLKPAMLDFIRQAEAGDRLHACLYEFRYLPVVQAFKDAIDRGVEVTLILDGKDNAHVEDGKEAEAFPLAANKACVAEAGIPEANLIWRAANKNYIQHNKFIILRKKGDADPSAVWTGSTNVSESALFGQTNVGHWIRNRDVALRFEAYWNLLSADPGGAPDGDRAGNLKKNKAYKADVTALQADFKPDTIADDIPEGTTALFSPRASLDTLDGYVKLLDGAQVHGAITLAFGINDRFKQALMDDDAAGRIIFMLLEKKDEPNPRSKKAFIEIGPKNNVYEAWGSYLNDPVYNISRETNAIKLGLGQHVSYIHSKFLLRDPLGDDPIVVTGSANFSESSVQDNDENMLLIRGNARVADIYFTEFNRLFNHYYFRSVYEELRRDGGSNPEMNVFLLTDDSWLGKYKPGSLRRKRVDIFTGMARIQAVTEVLDGVTVGSGAPSQPDDC